MQTVPYAPAVAEKWDSFIQNCPMATFLHSRRFLSYHGDRFKDCSLVFADGEKMLGVLPAAQSGRAAESHPGATFGGVIHNGELSGEKMREAVNLAAKHYRRAGFDSFIYKAPPACYRRRPADDDLCALHELGAKLISCKLSCVINLADRGKIAHARRKGRSKAMLAGLAAACGMEYLPAIWRLVEDNMRRRHNTAPVHSPAEIAQLAEMFPNNIKFHAGMLAGEIVCGGVLFLSDSVWHAQYVHSNETGRKIYALDFFYEHLIGLAAAAGMRHFSFGPSNNPQAEGGALNEKLHAFKKQFGGGGEAHLAFSLPLV
ncbi:MAG: GNAT family N-acetyltransferase [Betaproteobacteria bacterium]|nr:GNAT family N-acetyltransferase [Betaproteobacteria bacterium]